MTGRRPHSKTARWLDLLALLLNRRSPVTREEICALVPGYGLAELDAEPSERQVDTARRTFERDKAELRALGIAIERVRFLNAEYDEPADAYRLRARRVSPLPGTHRECLAREAVSRSPVDRGFR